MDEDWWKNLKSETIKDRLPGVFIIGSTGLIFYILLVVLLWICRPWLNKPKPNFHEKYVSQVQVKRAEIASLTSSGLE
ncbi:hypothetical protein [Nostoc sp.]|uniref:hypothetical protein n=1 Tax=Nostoc sp. TaxID=1180 RepID=UPI002FFB0A3C